MLKKTSWCRISPLYNPKEGLGAGRPSDARGAAAGTWLRQQDAAAFCPLDWLCGPEHCMVSLECTLTSQATHQEASP